MNDLLLIRHAQTDMAGTFCGQSDPPVNNAGHLQIRRLIESLRTEPIAAVYTSDLRRALTTAHALAEFFAVPCIARPRLREIYFGKWEGLIWKEIEQRDACCAIRWLDSFPNTPAPEGEPVESFEARVRAETRYLLHHKEQGLIRPDKSSIAIVTHAGVIRTMLRSDCNLDENEAWSQTKQYCSTIRYNPGIHSLRKEQR